MLHVPDEDGRVEFREGEIGSQAITVDITGSHMHLQRAQSACGKQASPRGCIYQIHAGLQAHLCGQTFPVTRSCDEGLGELCAACADRGGLAHFEGERERARDSQRPKFEKCSKLIRRKF